MKERVRFVVEWERRWLEGEGKVNMSELSSPRKPRTNPRLRRAPPPIDVCYRIPYVGTVAVIDKKGEALRMTWSRV
jgi:hypothetical protein